MIRHLLLGSFQLVGGFRGVFCFGYLASYLIAHETYLPPLPPLSASPLMELMALLQSVSLAAIVALALAAFVLLILTGFDNLRRFKGMLYQGIGISPD